MTPPTPPTVPAGLSHIIRGASPILMEASDTAKAELGRVFAAQRTWLTGQEYHQGLRDARATLRKFRTTTRLPVDRIGGIGGHWGRHPVLAWMATDHYALIAAWLLEGGSLPGEWCRPASSAVPTPGVNGTIPTVLSSTGEKVLAQWFVRWGETNARFQNTIGRALCAWIRRADVPSPRTPDWAMSVHATQNRPVAIASQEPAAVTFRAAITLVIRGVRVIPMLRAMQRSGWNFEQAERLPLLPGRPPQITSARTWLIALGIEDQLTSPANKAWHAWWMAQDRAVLESTLAAETTPSSPMPTGRSRSRL